MDKHLQDLDEWFETHKEKDGTINISKYPPFLNYLRSRYLTSADAFKKLDDLPKNIGNTVNFDLSNIKRS